MSLAGKHYLLTGASGYLGYHLVRQLVADGATVRIFDLVTLEPKSHFHLDDGSAARVACVEGNVLKQGSIEDALQGIDGIFHLAGVVHPPYLFSDSSFLCDCEKIDVKLHSRTSVVPWI